MQEKRDLKKISPYTLWTTGPLIPGRSGQKAGFSISVLIVHIGASSQLHDWGLPSEKCLWGKKETKRNSLLYESLLQIAPAFVYLSVLSILSWILFLISGERLLDLLHLGWNQKYPHCDINLHSPDNREVGASFLPLFLFWSFEYLLLGSNFEYFFNFLISFLCFSYWLIEVSLYIQNMCPFFINVFSYSVYCPFTLFMVFVYK